MSAPSTGEDEDGPNRTIVEPVRIGCDSSERLGVSVEEASQLLGISKWLGYELVAQGKLPALRLGRRLVVPLAALSRMLDCSVTEAASGPGDGLPV